MKKIILSFLSMLLPLMASAEKITFGGIVYDIDYTTNEAAVVNVEPGNTTIDKGDLVIPAKLDIKELGIENISVTSIAKNVFMGFEKLTSVSIPSTMKSIGFRAFAYCKGITSITIPSGDIGSSAFCGCTSLSSLSLGSGVTSIGYQAFSGCESLSSLTIPSKVTTIGYGAFSGCNGLTSLTIPSNVTTIGDGAFSSCNGLTSVTIEKGSIGGSAFRSCKSLSSLTLNNGVTSIGDYAFYECRELTTLTIPNSVSSIGEYAFQWCKKLESVKIGSGVTSVGGQAFGGCEKLTSVHISDLAAWCNIDFYDPVGSNPLYYAHHLFLNGEEIIDMVIPDGVTTIKKNAFKSCPDLQSVSIPTSVTSIGGQAFSGCSGLSSITIPNGVESIGACAFEECSGLTSVTIGSGVTSMGAIAFYNCENLTSVHISDLAAWCNIDFDGYSTNPLIYAHHLFMNNEEITDLVIPNSITAIKDYTFEGCLSLTSVMIHDNVTSIGERAFNSSGLSDFYCKAEQVPACHNYAFDNGESGMTLHVPSVSIEAYQDVEPWKNFGKIIALDIKGDANMDGIVDANDIDAVVNFIMSKEAGNNFSLDNANGDVDNQLNVADIVLMLNRLRGQALLGETAFYLIGDHNGWDMTDKTYAFTKLADGKTWEITIPSEGAGCFKIAPESAYDHQDGTFWSYLLCAESDQHTGLHGIMQQGDIMAAWLLNTEGATSYTIRIVPSEMTYKIIPN